MSGLGPIALVLISWMRSKIVLETLQLAQGNNKVITFNGEQHTAFGLLYFLLLIFKAELLFSFYFGQI